MEEIIQFFLPDLRSLFKKFLSWLYTYRLSRFDMFVHYIVNYFVRLRTNHYILLTISPILFIFDSARNLTRNLQYRPLSCFVKITIARREEKNNWRDGLQNTILHFSFLSFSRQFDDKCIAGFKYATGTFCSYNEHF